MKRLQMLVVGAITLAMIAVVFSGRRKSASIDGQTLFRPKASAAASPRSERVRRQQASPSRTAESRVEGVAELKSRFGEALELKLDSAGCLESARGAPGGVTSVQAFDPSSAQKVLARAKDVMEIASHLLCIDSEFPLGEPVFSGGAVSAQISYHETREGLPVIPRGSVSLSLGPKGELLSIASSYSGQGTIANALTLSEPQAREMAAVAGAGKATEGRGVLWVDSRAPGGAATLLYAYEFYVGGKQVVIDAGDGRLLLKHDRRME